MKTNGELVPLLVVRGAANAIEFYARALGAEVLARYEHGPDRHLSHADLAIAGARLALTEEVRSWNSDAPPSLGGSPVVLQLNVHDAEATVSLMCEAGATVVYPVTVLFGERVARVRDPFGHLWIVHQRIEELSAPEIQRQRDELFARFTGAAKRASPGPAKDQSRVGDAAPAQQAQTDALASDCEITSRRGRIHLVLGPVGAGKSTFALRLAHEQAAVRLTLDAWMAELFSPDRPDSGVIEWYVARAARCVSQIWSVTAAVLDAGTNVVLEIGLIKRAEREQFYRRAAEASVDLTIHVLDAPRNVRRERVQRRNHEKGSTFSMLVPPAIFELASDLWEPVETDECEGRRVEFIRTDVS